MCICHSNPSLLPSHHFTTPPAFLRTIPYLHEGVGRDVVGMSRVEPPPAQELCTPEASTRPSDHLSWIHITDITDILFLYIRPALSSDEALGFMVHSPVSTSVLQCAVQLLGESCAP